MAASGGDHDDHARPVHDFRPSRLTDEHLEEQCGRIISNSVRAAMAEALRDKHLVTDTEWDELESVVELGKRLSWLGRTIKAFALAIAAIVAGATVGLDAIKTILKRLLS